MHTDCRKIMPIPKIIHSMIFQDTRDINHTLKTRPILQKSSKRPILLSQCSGFKNARNRDENREAESRVKITALVSVLAK